MSWTHAWVIWGLGVLVWLYGWELQSKARSRASQEETAEPPPPPDPWEAIDEILAMTSHATVLREIPESIRDNPG
jgi:hypothetical protein